MADADDLPPPDEPKRRRRKERFKERDERDDDDIDDRPAKKRAVEPEEDDDSDDIPPSDRVPVTMLLALIGGALVLLTMCVGCGVWSWSTLFGLGSGGGGGGWAADEFVVTSADFQRPRTPFDSPRVSWAVNTVQDPSKQKQYFVVMQCSGQEVIEPLSPFGKGWSTTKSQIVPQFQGLNGPVEVWVEHRANRSVPGTRVSNVYTAR